ncbi:hypothetical protein BDW02DRAFT_645357 [Decorospora gaudefroyi]|uniref:DNA2/NAM7 helicase-like C-terminal domain-containing protein n=1 Tax=Decorospora gaudefroyi TaxID=184978 RepID=A0A6A5KGZ9_9PLEO|nr:hypothetical protein BDW02DRAFT_645357 [Decorospora gaudefroyi]
MVALVVDSANLDMPGQQAIQPIDLITIEDVFSKKEVAAIEELPMFHSDEYVVPHYGVPTLSDEHARGRSQTAHPRQQRDQSLPGNRDLTSHQGQRRDQSAPPRLRNKDLYERTAIPLSKATKHDEVEGLRLFADTMLSEKRYNLGMAKTHMLKYGDQFNSKHVVREALLFQRQRKVNYLTQNKAKFIRDHLRYHNNVIVSKRTLLEILFRGQRVASAGSLPYTKTDIEDDEVRVEQQDKLILARKPEKGKEKWLSKEEKRAIKEEALLKARKAFKPLSAHSADACQEFKQNTDTKVHLVIAHHPQTKTVAHLIITANYIHESQPGVQPSHEAQINLTDRNLRPRPLVTVPGLPEEEYEPHYTITDVTHESWCPRLHKLFNVGRNKTYFRDMQKAILSTKRLLLITARHNDMPWCSNLLVNDYPTDTHRALGTAMEHSPRIYLLVRADANNIEDMMTCLVQDFAAQVTYDPLTDLYCNPTQHMVVNSTNVKSLADRPKFVTPAGYTFETFQDYQNRAGIGALIEHKWKENQNTHTAKAVFVPIRETWDKLLKLYMTYVATVILDKDSHTKVALTKDDTVQVTIEPDNPATPADFWRGKVVPRQNIPGMAGITIIIERPRNRNGTTNNTRSDFCSLAPREIDETNIAQLKSKIMNSKRVAVKITSPLELKEMKLHMDALNRFTVNTKLLEKDAAKYHALKQHQNFFICHAPKHLDKKGIYDDIDQAHRQDDHVRNQLLDYQQVWLDKLIDQGMLDATALLGGPSGCGKTRAIAEVAMPFLGSIKVPNDDVVRKQNELHAFFNQTSKKKDKDTDGNMDSTAPTEDITSPSPPESSAQENDKQSGLYGKTRSFEIGTPCFTLPSKELDYTLERGRITAITAQNETVEELFTTYSSTAIAYCKAVGLPVPLVIELDLPFAIDQEITPQPGTHSERLYKAYVKMYQGSEFRSIRDPRFKHLESSEAHRVLQFLLDDDQQPEELKACFTKDERAMIRQQFQPLRYAEKDLMDNKGTFTQEIDDQILHAAKLGLDWIEQKANVVVTTASLGLEPRFAMMRRPHAVVIEEITRMSDAVLWGYWSKYWDVLARLGSGDWRQLGPQLFGKKIDNPFHPQVKLPLLGRAYATGFPVHQFMVTHRFGNEELLNICQLVIKLPQLAMSDTAEQQEKTKKIMNVHKDLKNKRSACVFVDVQESNPQKDATGSYYNVRTAVTTLHIINALVDAMQGTCIAVISPYNAQTNLHQYLCGNAIQMAKDHGDQSHAEQLEKITFSTIDSYMGKENEYIFVDTLAHIGHLMEIPRTIVAFTRARLGLSIVGNAAVHSSAADNYSNSHPLKTLTRRLCESRRFFDMNTRKQRKLIQYTDALQALGLSAGEKIVDLRFGD